MSLEAIFHNCIQPICSQIIQFTNRDVIDKVNLELMDISDEIVDRFQDYLLTPLLTQIDNVKGL